MQQEFYALAAFFIFYKIANYIYCTLSLDKWKNKCIFAKE